VGRRDDARIEGDWPRVADGDDLRAPADTHPDDKSTALAVRDEVLTALGTSFPVPFTLEVGQSTEFSASITVQDQAGCLRLSEAAACGTVAAGAFQVVFDGGVAQCAARLVCLRDDAARGGGKGERR